MRRSLLDILACPVDKHYPLLLYELVSSGEKVLEGALFCSECERFYPIQEEIPIMLPDDLRRKEDDLAFLRKWVQQLPPNVVFGGKPVHLEQG